MRGWHRRAHAVPPQRIVVELEIAAHLGDDRRRWTEGERRHLQRRDFGIPGFLIRIREPQHREGRVDRAQLHHFLKWRSAAVGMRCLYDHRPSFPAERVAHCRIASSGGESRPRRPRRSHNDVAVHDHHILEPNPAAEPRAGGRPLCRVRREDPLVVPLGAGLAIQHDQRSHEPNVLQPDLLADERAERITSARLLGGEERLTAAVADREIVNR